MQPDTEGTSEGVEPPFEATRVADLLRQLDATVGALQLGPNHAAQYLEAAEKLRRAFAALWLATDAITLQVTDTAFMWFGVTVLLDAEKTSDSLPWTLFKDGVRELTFTQGFEANELERFLGIIPRVRQAQPSEDDVVTLLWEQDFAYLSYRFTDPVSAPGVPLETAATPGRWPAVANTADPKEAVADAKRRRSQGGTIIRDDGGQPARSSGAAHHAHPAPAAPAPGAPMGYLAREIEREYSSDLRRAVVDVLLDIFELNEDEAVREEVVGHLDSMLVNLLAASQAANVAYLLRESGLALARSPSVTPSVRARIQQLGDRARHAAFPDASPAAADEPGAGQAQDYERMARQRHHNRRLPAAGATKVAYAKSVAAASDIMRAVAAGQSPSLNPVKRTMQLIVDRILTDEASMLGLTTVRDYQDQTFTHAVNVSIFSVAMGRRLGLSRVQLYDLALAALFHDGGKSRMPEGILNKTGPLTDEEWQAITAHPWTGVLTLFHLREHGEYPYRAMMVSYEHHLRRDEGGYPKRLRPRPVGLYSKIVAVIEAFDAATTRLGHNVSPNTPAGVVKEMRENAHKFIDPVVMLAFTGMLGAYPVGTVLMLDTFELAIVHSVNPNPDLADRPMAMVISDDHGTVHYPGVLVDLGETNDEGSFKRTILEPVDPLKFGIRVGDYFL